MSQLILNWLRDPSAPRILPENKAELLRELDFYGLKDALLPRKPVLFAFGGWCESVEPQHGGHILSCVECLDLSSDVWVPCTPMPWSRGMTSVVQSEEGHLCLIGGRHVCNSSSLNKAVHIFDPDTGSWSMLASWPRARSFAGAASVHGDLYVLGGRVPTRVPVGGRDPTRVPVNIMERYDTRLQRWTVATPLIANRSAFGYASLGGYIYAVGGMGDMHLVLGSVERYSPKVRASFCNGNSPSR